MALLFDTSAVIGMIERRSPTLIALAERANTAILVSPLTIGELEHGVNIDRGPQPAETLRLAKSSLLREFFDPDTAPRCWALLRAANGRRLGVNDSWIAATSICGGHQLVTQDARQAAAITAVDWESTPWKSPDVLHVPVGQ